MKYYKDSLGNVYGYELNGSQDYLIGNKTQLTSAELEAHLAPKPQTKTQFTSLEYLDKFTEAEQLAVVSATLSNAQVKLWYDKMLAASYIDVNDPRTSAGLDALISAGLLASSRKAEILEPQVIA